MVKQVRHIITENERNRIRNLYSLNQGKRTYIFEACLSVNQRYFILQDEVFDIQEQKTLGNIWSSIEVFKTIFKNVNIENQEYRGLQESISSLPILEGISDLYSIRNILLEWNFFDDTWLGEKLKVAGHSIKDVTTQSLEGIKKLGVEIGKGEWSEILSLLSKGVLWILRKLKSAMYSTLGMIVDAILVATGIGKTIQWIPWALITALDVYQFLNNDWVGEEANQPTWLKLLFLGFDVLGLVTSGAVAKAARAEGKALSSIAKNPTKIAEFMKSNPKMKGYIKSIMNGLKKVPVYMSKAVQVIGNKFPKGAAFISGIVGKMSGVLKSMEQSLGKLVGATAAKGTMAGSKTTGLFYGVEKGFEKYAQWKTGFSHVQLKNMEKLDNIQKTYGGKDPFDI